MDLSTLTDSELSALREEIDGVLLGRENEDIAVFNYSAMRTQLLERFKPMQIEYALRPWRVLAKAKRKEYITAWYSATSTLKFLGFAENKHMYDLIVKLVTTYVPGNTLTFGAITASLDTIIDLVDRGFPGYLGDDKRMSILIAAFGE